MDWLGKITSTVLNAVTGSVIALLLTAFYIVTAALGIKIDPTVFGMMLGFAAAYSGLSVTQFKIKRDSEIVYPGTGVQAKDAASMPTAGVRASDLRGAADRRVLKPAQRDSRYDVGVRFKGPPKPDAVAAALDADTDETFGRDGEL